MSRVTTAARLTVCLGFAGVALAGATLPAPAFDDPWMTEEAMRSAFIGKTLDGYYGNGLTWTETYLGDGRLDYRESARRATGHWHFRGHVFCTFYDPPLPEPPLSGGCWTAIKTSANCYEFYLAGLSPEPPFEDDASGMSRRWNARGWRQEEPSTCSEKPSV
jgi:hypothetical protein